MGKKLTILAAALALGTAGAQAQVHTTYMWHLEQPIYWPQVSVSNPYQYQKVWESYQLKSNGNAQNVHQGISHPLNDLQEIFSKDDRRNIYQHVGKQSIETIDHHPDAGAQVNYSGCLMENVESLGAAGQWGYSNNWESSYATARSWNTSDGFPRADLTAFTFHHVLGPLASERMVRMQLKAHRFLTQQTFGNSEPYSKGFWPAEGAFSERLIPILVQEGIEWSVIANSHLARTLNDYMDNANRGTNGWNMVPPNAADQVSTNGNNWWNGQIDGRGGAFAAPYSYQAHKAQHVDPATGQIYKLDVVPMCDLLSYKDGYSPLGTGEVDQYIAPFDNPSQPSILLLCHDGDNAWGGGSSYYFEAVPGFTNAAAAKGYVPTTIQQFLHDHPVPANDIVRVEDGGWVNAANDWGHPQFINWIWPLYDPQTYRFNPDAWTEDARNWAVLTAADNFVFTASDIQGTPDIADVVQPNASSTLSERAWHHLMPAYNSGYMYYGAAIDMEVKPALAGNIAIDLSQQVLNANPGVDNTPPSVFAPQRFPYNPGGIGFGPEYGYQQVTNSSDFHVWTYAFDVSGIQSMVLKYRTDIDGLNPIASIHNDTYAGGNEVSAWTSLSMTQKVLDPAFDGNNPEIDLFILPTRIADLYYAEIAGLKDTLVDYYIEATDTKGNIHKSPIHHVYVGGENEGPGGGGGNERVYWEPAEPTLNDVITLTVTDATANTKMHWGVEIDGDSWNLANAAYRPAGTVEHGDGQAVQTPFTDPDGDGTFTVVLGPFNNEAQMPDAINFVLKYSDSYWDNNGGADYRIAISDQVVALDPAQVVEFSLKVYPNPSQDMANLMIVSPTLGQYQVAIYDLQGKVIHEQVMSDRLNPLDTRAWAPGLYFVKMTDPRTGQTVLERLTVF